MKTFATFILVNLLFIIIVKSQNFKAIAYYQTNSTVKVKMDSTKTDQNQQKALNEKIRRSMQKEFKLSINGSETLYEEVEKLKSPQAQGGITAVGLGAGIEGGLYKNTKENICIENRDCFGKTFLVVDSIERFPWKLVNESKKVGNYLCHKATYKKMDRNGKKQTTVTVWYTDEIPLNFGPSQYGGLPGLILEADNGLLNIKCTKLIINPQEEFQIKKPKRGKKVNKEQFDKIYQEKLDEFKLRYMSKD